MIFTFFYYRENIAECAIPAAYRIARHAIPATCANRLAVIHPCVVILAILVVVTYVVATIDYTYATALIVNFMSKRPISP